MIKLSSDLSGIKPETVTLMNIFCLKSAFEGSVLEADIWTQTNDGAVTAVIARNSGRLYIHSFSDDYDEIKDFIKVIGYGEVFCDISTARALDLSVVREFSVLSVRGDGKIDTYESDISLKTLFERLMLGADGNIELPDFDSFAPDLSHRLRHGGAKAFLSENGAAIVFLCDFGGIVNGIAVSKEKRLCGEGSWLIKSIKDCTDGELFVCCDEKIKDFYIKNGFFEKGNAVIAR